MLRLNIHPYRLQKNDPTPQSSVIRHCYLTLSYLFVNHFLSNYTTMKCIKLQQENFMAHRGKRRWLFTRVHVEGICSTHTAYA